MWCFIFWLVPGWLIRCEIPVCNAMWLALARQAYAEVEDGRK